MLKRGVKSDTGKYHLGTPGNSLSGLCDLARLDQKGIYQLATQGCVEGGKCQVILNGRTRHGTRSEPASWTQSPGAKHYARAVQRLRMGDDGPIYIALSQMPAKDVLYICIIIDGRIRIRLNIAGYEPGDRRKCWDESYKTPKVWAICTGPAVKPPEKLFMRGFQGIRYTEDLW